MRRKDREMSREFGLQVIDKAAYGTVALNEDYGTYSLPLSIVRDEEKLYFHSAQSGKKVDILNGEPRVCISFVGEVSVPENFSHEELLEISQDKQQMGKLISRVFTTQFESALVFGKVKVVEEREEKIHALELVCKKYTPSKMEFFSAAIEAGLERVQVYSLHIDELTAKRKKLDEQGEEMKFGRME